MSILLKNIFKKGSEKESFCVQLLRLQNRVVSAAARPVWGHLALPWVCGGGAGRRAPCRPLRVPSTGGAQGQWACRGQRWLKWGPPSSLKCCLGFLCVFTSVWGTGLAGLD